MAQGTDVEILGKTGKLREPNGSKGGRPAVNRELVVRNLKLTDDSGKPRYTYSQIAKIARCSSRTIKRIANEARLAGDLTVEDRDGAPVGIVEADFDEECRRAMGYSFKEWLETKFKKNDTAQYHFNFTAKIWETIWNKCSIVEMSERQSKLCDVNAMEFVKAFGDDSKRMRRRLKMIRFIFRFLGRSDVCERHLKMSNTKHPRNKRRVPEITMIDFPKKFESCVDEMVQIHGPLAELVCDLKVSTQMRTGEKADDRELLGIRKGSESKSYLIMSGPGPDDFRFHVYAKKGESWDIIWLPEKVRQMLWAHYQTVENGAILFPINKKTWLKNWGEITERTVGRWLNFHDMRKISITWFYTLGIRLEIATMINVGWKDLSTAHQHYLDISRVLRSSYRKEYSDGIPAWFKDGLGEFMDENAVDKLPSVGGDDSVKDALMGQSFR